MKPFGIALMNYEHYTNTFNSLDSTGFAKRPQSFHLRSAPFRARILYYGYFIQKPFQAENFEF